MRCPACASVDDKVVDSRTADDGTAIRRRRECLECGTRFTTFERLEEVPLVVVKRSGDHMPFERERVVRGIEAAAKGRPVEPEQMEALAAAVEDQFRLLGGGEVPSEAIGLAVLERLRDLDGVAYVRFASVYRQFRDIDELKSEIDQLTKGELS